MGWRIFFIALALCAAACSDSSVPAAPGGGTGGRPIIPLPTGGSGGTGAGTGAGGTGASNGTGGSSGSGGTTGTGGMAGSGGQSAGGGAGGIGSSNACSSVTDNDLLNGLLNQTPSSNGRFVAHRCAVETCAPQVGQGEMVFRQCVTDCVETDIAGLSRECATCYGDLAWNAVPLCNTPCAQSEVASCGVLCLTCDNDNYRLWVEELDACAGRRSVDCPE